MSRYESGDDESDNNEDKVYLLLDDMGGSRIRSRARSRVGSHDHRSCDHGVTICFILTIIDLKMVYKELLGLAKLTKAQNLYIYKLTKVIMVSKNKYFVFVVF